MSNNMTEFNMRTFSEEPSGRFYTDGAGSGEEFREEYLKVLLTKHKVLKITLDDEVEGYGSSFLVEGFAGMVKYGYMKSDILLNKLEFTFENDDFEFYKDKIIEYIKDAKFDSEIYISTKES